MYQDMRKQLLLAMVEEQLLAENEELQNPSILQRKIFLFGLF